ncbi:MAG: hypothetical protein RJB60_177 [Pseudomonadota bacterium]|jgi:hypothetical protein
MTQNMNPATFELHRDAHGQLVYTGPDGVPHEGVVPVRAFPLSAPDEGVSIVASNGHELLWIDQLSALPAKLQQALSEELASRDFAPVIQRLVSVSTFATPSIWTVETDRGPTSFSLKSEDDIRRLPNMALLIGSGHGVTFHVRDRMALDKESRRLLERFL